MKKKKKFGFTIIFTLIFTAVIFLTTKTRLLPAIGLATDVSDTSEQEILNDIDNGKRVVLVYGMTNDEFNHVVDLVYDNPYFYWLDMKYKALSVGNLHVLLLSEKYADLEYLDNLIEEKSNEVIEEIVTDSMSDYDKALKIHDWICNHIRYTETYKDGDQEVYGALIEGKARCAGYAKLFTILLDKVGIKSEVISGLSTSNEETVAHAWNLAYLDGKPYYFDLTWDDNEEIGLNHHWFAVTQAEFSQTHFPSEGYEWNYDAVDTEHNYYIKQNLYVKNYNYKYISNMLRTVGKEFSLKFASKDVMEHTIKMITNQEELQKIMRDTNITYIKQITYEMSEGVNCIHVKFE